MNVSDDDFIKKLLELLDSKSESLKVIYCLVSAEGQIGQGWKTLVLTETHGLLGGFS